MLKKHDKKKLPHIGFQVYGHASHIRMNNVIKKRFRTGFQSSWEKRALEYLNDN